MYQSEKINHESEVLIMSSKIISLKRDIKHNETLFSKGIEPTTYVIRSIKLRQ